jgi:DNA-binding transcriptional regulator YiaG
MDAHEQTLVILARRVCVNGEFRLLRERLGLSLNEAADYLHLDPGALSRYERGVRKPGAARSIELGDLVRRWRVVDTVGPEVAAEVLAVV